MAGGGGSIGFIWLYSISCGFVSFHLVTIDLTPLQLVLCGSFDFLSFRLSPGDFTWSRAASFDFT